MIIRPLLLAALVLFAARLEGAKRNGPAPVPAGCDLRPAPAGARAEADPPPGDGRKYLYLRKAAGNLMMYGHASSDTYQVCFHVPIPFHEQAPILLQVDCPQLVDYRFVQEDPPNLLVAARLVGETGTRYETCRRYGGIRSTSPLRFARALTAHS